jgi:hypothetical protein
MKNGTKGMPEMMIRVHVVHFTAAVIEIISKQLLKIYHHILKYFILSQSYQSDDTNVTALCCNSIQNLIN